VSTLLSPRRYYLAKRHAAADAEDTALEAVWQAKQEAESGTALADDFPYLTRLIAAGYSTEEDLAGADATELEAQGFASREAAAIVAAAAE
jgi:hypothetical protein